MKLWKILGAGLVSGVWIWFGCFYMALSIMALQNSYVPVGLRITLVPTLMALSLLTIYAGFRMLIKAWADLEKYVLNGFQ